MLGFVDIAVFTGFMLLSVFVGVYHGYKSSRISSTQDDGVAEFLLGNRKLPIVPVCLSLLTTFVSGIALLGQPAEVYHRGLMFIFPSITGSVAIIFSAIFFLPIFYKLKMTSVYEYFEIRFDSKLLRRIGSLLFLFNTLAYMAVVMYAPAVALVQVTKSTLWPFILGVGFVSTLYTTLGGIKAVIWTDALQGAFMYVGLFTLIIKGTIEVGGISKVFETSYETGRLTKAMARFSPTPFQYQSVWIMLFGTFMDWMSYYGLNQMALQRYCSMPSLKNARIVMAMTVPAFTLIGWMCCYIGLLMLTYFSGCDPLLTGEVSTKDEMNVLMATRILSFLPGFQGLFLSSLFSSTLSTVSSGMNSMTAVIYEDFIKGSTHRAIKDRNSTCVNRMITLVIGILTTALAFACQVLGGTFNAATSTLGATAGPLAGVFCLGIFFPKANKYGAFIGLACSILLTVTCSTSYNIVRQYDDYKYPLPTERSPTCSNLSMSKNPYLNLNNSETFHDRSNLHFGRSGTLIFSQVSVFLYAAIGVCSVFVIGAIASLLLPYNADPAKRRMAYACTYKGLKVPFRRVNRSTNYKVNLDQIKPLDKS